MGKKILIYGFIVLFVIILIFSIVRLQNPLRRSEEKIKESILELTPIGTSMEDVIKVIENQNEWELRWVDYDYGYEKPTSGKYIGEKSIRVFIGEYRNIFKTSITVLWGFDENAKLINIYIWKDVDAL